MHPSSRRVFAAGMIGVLLVAIGASGQDWPCWRGPRHDGISAETGLEAKWESAPPTVWEADLGSGFSGIVCVDGKLYTCGTRDGKQVLFCLDADSGKILWQQALAEAYRESTGGDGPRGTPTVDEGRVYVQAAQGRLACFQAGDGKEVWSRQFEAAPQWGYSGSVLIEGNMAIAIGGDSDGPLIALDKKTGKSIWKCGSGPAGYSTPYAFTFDGGRYVVGFLGKVIVIADVKSGQEVWSLPWQTDWDVNAATPIYNDGRLFLSSGYGHGSVLLKLSRAGDKLNATPVWEDKSILAKFQTPVLYEGNLYTSDEAQRLTCVDFATGTAKWSRRNRSFRHGTVVLAEGRLFVLTENGRLLIGPASPDGFEPTTDVQILSGRCWTVPTLYKGRLYARNLDKLVCLRLTR